MTVEKRKNIGIGAIHDQFNFYYSAEIFQEIVAFKIGEMKIIPHPDGNGQSIVVRFDTKTFTVITKRYMKDGFFKQSFKVLNDVLEYREDGVYQNGRKL